MTLTFKEKSCALKASGSAGNLHQRAAYKVKLYVLPVVCLVTFVNYLDRGNIAYAADGLQGLLKMDDTVYGLVCGSLFYTYVLFQWLHAWVAGKLGVRQWLTAIVFLWGLATFLTSWVTAIWQLVVIRLLVGFAESGSFPLIYMHLDSLMPDKDVAFCWSIVIAFSQIASIFSGPIAAGIISIPLSPGITADWQWLFIIEGGLAILSALIVFMCLLEPLETTTALSEEEKEALKQAKDSSASGQKEKQNIAKGARDWKAWYLGVVSSLIATPVYAFMFFSPSLIQKILGPDAPKTAVDSLNGIPYVVAMFVMLFVGISIKQSGDRLYHVIIGTILAAALAFSFPATFSSNSIGAFVQMNVLYGISAGLYIPLDTMPSAYCDEPAGSYPILNSLKSIGGFIGPLVFGAVKQTVNGEIALAVLGIFEIIGLVMFLLFFVLIGQAKASFGCHQRKKGKSADALPCAGSQDSQIENQSVTV